MLAHNSIKSCLDDTFKIFTRIQAHCMTNHNSTRNNFTSHNKNKITINNVCPSEIIGKHNLKIIYNRAFVSTHAILETI